MAREVEEEIKRRLKRAGIEVFDVFDFERNVILTIMDGFLVTSIKGEELMKMIAIVSDVVGGIEGWELELDAYLTAGEDKEVTVLDLIIEKKRGGKR